MVVGHGAHNVLSLDLGRYSLPKSVDLSPIEVHSLCCVGCRSICVEGMLCLNTSDCAWTYSRCIRAVGAWPHLSHLRSIFLDRGIGGKTLLPRQSSSFR